MPKHDDSRLKCSFCGKSQDQVKKLIAGPEVYICDECVELCNQILDEEFLKIKIKKVVKELMLRLKKNLFQNLMRLRLILMNILLVKMMLKRFCQLRFITTINV